MLESMYDRDLVAPMWQELEEIGVRSLETPEAVDEAMKDTEGTTLILVNSVCGCAAGSARPGVALALQNEVIPDRLYTVFAGVDRAATERAREHMGDVPPSSPSVAIFKDGELAFMLPRRSIEGHSESEVAEMLAEAFDTHCARRGPSVPRERMLKAFATSSARCSSELKAR